MKPIFKLLLATSLSATSWLSSYATTDTDNTGNFADTTRAYAVPTVSKTPQGTVALSWTEKDKAGVSYLYWAESRDKGQHFGDKRLIYSAAGIGGSRLMRPKLLFKKDGSLVAIFSMPGGSVAQPVPARTEATSTGHDHGMGHEGNKAHSDQAPKSAPKTGGRPSDLQIVYCLSKDQGKTWSQPTPVHADKTPNMVRGFFDAIVLANGEIGVAYLNDIEGKQHQRDLKFVTSKGDHFGQEKTLDPFVCDCCNISLLVDNKGALNLYYRENQENIRDIAKMVSTDNGVTFSKADILFADNWKINGCPHSGPTSSANASGNLVAWMSGTTDKPGIRVVTQQGKRLFVLEDQSAKNAFLVSAPNSSILLWEQNQSSEAGLSSVIAWKNIVADQNPDTQVIKGSINGTNATGVVVDNQLVIAYEIKGPNNKNSVGVTHLAL